MAKYICLVESPTTDAPLAVNQISEWPKLIRVPENKSRDTDPEGWMKENLLSNFPNSIVTLYVSHTSYEPATHTKIERT